MTTVADESKKLTALLTRVRYDDLSEFAERTSRYAAAWVAEHDGLDDSEHNQLRRAIYNRIARGQTN